MGDTGSDHLLFIYVGIPLLICILLGLLAAYLYRRGARERAKLLEMSRKERLHHKCRDLHCCIPHSYQNSQKHRSSAFSTENRLSEVPDENESIPDVLSQSMSSEETCPAPPIQK